MYRNASSKDMEKRLEASEHAQKNVLVTGILTTTSIIMLPFAPAKPEPPKVYTSCATTADTKNIETPMGPRSANTPVAGKMIMPSEDKGRQL